METKNAISDEDALEVEVRLNKAMATLSGAMDILENIDNKEAQLILQRIDSHINEISDTLDDLDSITQ